ncbi:hypothetical protein RZS08_35790, partial [Arthrospira platensis SPKY1]|nr:hypothetical protein [Arthrospira platensis SPKY1]
VNPKHFKLVIRNSGKGKPRTLVTRMRMSAAMGKRQGKLTPEDVKAIRESTETPQELAKRFGVTAGNIGLIRNHRTYKDYSSPYVGMFSGLLAANTSAERKRA